MLIFFNYFDKFQINKTSYKIELVLEEENSDLKIIINPTIYEYKSYDNKFSYYCLIYKLKKILYKT